MSVAGILKVILFVFAGICLLFGLRMLLTGMRSRGAASRQFFNVGRLEAQRKVFSSMLSTIGLVLLALLFLVGALLIPDDFLGDWFNSGEEPVAEAGVEPTNESDDGESAGADLEEMTDEVAISVEPGESPTATPIPTETPSPTPTRNYVYVNSPIVGLYIRDLPDGDIIDVLDDRSRLSLSGESTVVNGINWILVLTDEEREGWVAEQFTTNSPPEIIEPTPES